MYQSNSNLFKRKRNCFYYVHKWLDDVEVEQVVLRISFLIWEMYKATEKNCCCFLVFGQMLAPNIKPIYKSCHFKGKHAEYFPQGFGLELGHVKISKKYYFVYGYCHKTQ